MVGWRISNSLRTDRALDTLEQARHARKNVEGVIHHSDRRSQCIAFRYTPRLAEAGVERSVGSVGDSYDNALAESTGGLFKTEVIRRLGPWRSVDDVELATLRWVHWFNNKRLLESNGYKPPLEFEARYHQQHRARAMVVLT